MTEAANDPAAHTTQGARLGVLAILASTAIWGVSPLYYALMNDIPAIEIVVHRTLWSLPFILVYILISGRRARFVAAARSPRLLAAMLFSTLLIAANWFVFVWAIQIGRTYEASFGYYVYPVVVALLGALVFGERLSRLQWVAVAIAAGAMAWLSAGFDAPPWIAIFVTISFATYGVVRKLASVGPLIGVAWELVLIAPFMLGYLAWVDGGVFGTDARQSWLLVGGAFFTAFPLVLFVEAAKLLRYATVGVLFYINPTLQLVSAFILGEAIGGALLAAFGAIWVAVMIYCFDLIRQERRASTRSRAASGVSSTS